MVLKLELKTGFETGPELETGFETGFETSFETCYETGFGIGFETEGVLVLKAQRGKMEVKMPKETMSMKDGSNPKTMRLCGW